MNGICPLCILPSLPFPSFFGAFDELNISIISYVFSSGNIIFENFSTISFRRLLALAANNFLNY